jgi:lipopolysaccharide/colanic/teichoic acid biosynthesis glycosyltransferase
MIENILRRCIDVLGACVGLGAAAPILLAAALAVWLKDGRPLLFGQVRDGLHGRPIRIWKLRTMVGNADWKLDVHLAASPAARAEWKRYFRLADDPRILGGTGRLLRRFSVDEIPQLWNVLRGEMSLVGPRPLPPRLTAMVSTDFLALRRVVRPGLTGLWQVSGRSALDIDQLIAVDSRYLTQRSIGLDLRIILATPAAVLVGAGAF